MKQVYSLIIYSFASGYFVGSATSKYIIGEPFMFSATLALPLSFLACLSLRKVHKEYRLGAE